MADPELPASAEHARRDLTRAMRLIGTPGASRLADALRRAAAHPAAPRRLQRAADAVLDGRFSWDDVVSGHCAHPYSLSLFTPAAEREMWPRVLTLIEEGAEPVVEKRPPPPEDEDFSAQTYTEKAR
jgi:hypothetical protein